MFEHVDHLLSALVSIQHRLTVERRIQYLKLLDEPADHQETLVEMIPAAKVSEDIAMEFEVKGLGSGNGTVDWVIGPHDGRTLTRKNAHVSYRTMVGAFLVGSAPNVVVVADPAIIAAPLGPKGVVVSFATDACLLGSVGGTASCSVEASPV